MVDGDCAGINGVEWDAVELPSQFMENWCYHRPTVDQVCVHGLDPLARMLYDLESWSFLGGFVLYQVYEVCCRIGGGCPVAP